MVLDKTTTVDAKNKTAPSASWQVQPFGSGQAGTVATPESWHLVASPILLAQSIVVQRSRQRIRRAHTKDRSEVRGGGRKPWRQKGTGRARHGSIRSPIWVGGGVTFGPRSRSEYTGSLPKAMKRRALSGAFAQQLGQGRLGLIKLEKILPETTRAFRQALPEVHGTITLILAPDQMDLSRVARNVPKVLVVSADRVTPRDVLVAKQVLISAAALLILEKRSKASRATLAT